MHAKDPNTGVLTKTEYNALTKETKKTTYDKDGKVVNVEDSKAPNTGVDCTTNPTAPECAAAFCAANPTNAMCKDPYQPFKDGQDLIDFIC